MPNMRDLAKASGFSLATVSRALQNDPLVKPDTQEAILMAAEKIGYEVNPYVGKFMSSMRRKQLVGFRGNLAIIWHEQPFFQEDGMLTNIRDAAAKRALDLGYCIDEFTLGEYRAERLTKILLNRGIRGVLISPSLSTGKTRLRLDTSQFACAVLGWAVLHPALHSVRVDHFHAMRLALHHGRHQFGRGIAAFCSRDADRRADHSWRAAFLAHHPAGESVAGKLFIDPETARPEVVLPLLQKHRVRCIIGESEERIPDWALEEVPSTNIIYLTSPKDAPCYGWVNARWDLSGAWGVNSVTASMERHEYGVPEVPKITLVPPQWVPCRG